MPKLSQGFRIAPRLQRGDCRALKKLEASLKNRVRKVPSQGSAVAHVDSLMNDQAARLVSSKKSEMTALRIERIRIRVDSVTHLCLGAGRGGSNPHEVALGGF